jgi:ribosomal protein L30
MSKVNIKLIKSLIGRSEKQIKTAESLGLKKVGNVMVHTENPVLNGKIRVISHLIEVEK